MPAVPSMIRSEAASMTNEPAELKKGDTIEGFRVMGTLGRGAASIIYLAQDTRTKQIRALKHVQRNDPKQQRFLDQAIQEAEVARELDHEAFRKIYRVIKKGPLLRVREVYLVMELVDGSTMESHPPNTFEDAVQAFRQVADGLAHMHSRGYVHADMKPNNVVITADGRAKIIDLGQSCKIGTVKPRIQGTPDYIAPEQVHRREITERTDVYNLGATLYWVLTGKNIPTAIGKGDSLVDSLDDNLIEKPTPIRDLAPQAPEQLADLIMQCVEVNPANRPQSMEEVADKLEFMLARLRAEKQRLKGGSGVAMQALSRESARPTAKGESA